jgi:NAD(P)H-dependent flavin oxidoreductase YrpB (nitropropane dioxygenase family)
MTNRPIFRTKLCDILEIEYPIMLAGMGSMGKATPPALVAAVSNAGGMGVIGGAGLEPETIREKIRETRALTDKPIGVDLLLPVNLDTSAEPTRSSLRKQIERDYPKHYAFMRGQLETHGISEILVESETVVSVDQTRKQVEVVLEEDVQVFAAGLGDPSWVVPMAHEKGMTVIGLVGSPRNAERQAAAGCDIVIAQGYEAGGHTGKIANFPLIPQVVDAVAPIPVVAAGGIADGRGIAAALSLGAIGAWIGTAFIVAEEGETHDENKQQIIDGHSQQFDPQRWYSGKPSRLFGNDYIKAWEASGLEPLPMPYQRVITDDFNESVAAAGKLELHMNPAGQIAGMITERKPAKQIMEDLVTGAIATLEEMRDKVTIGE